MAKGSRRRFDHQRHDAGPPPAEDVNRHTLGLFLVRADDGAPRRVTRGSARQSLSTRHFGDAGSVICDGAERIRRHDVADQQVCADVDGYDGQQGGV